LRNAPHPPSGEQCSRLGSGRHGGSRSRERMQTYAASPESAAGSSWRRSSVTLFDKTTPVRQDDEDPHRGQGHRRAPGVSHGHRPARRLRAARQPGAAEGDHRSRLRTCDGGPRAISPSGGGSRPPALGTLSRSRSGIRRTPEPELWRRQGVSVERLDAGRCPRPLMYAYAASCERAQGRAAEEPAIEPRGPAGRQIAAECARLYPCVPSYPPDVDCPDADGAITVTGGTRMDSTVTARRGLRELSFAAGCLCRRPASRARPTTRADSRSGGPATTFLAGGSHHLGPRAMRPAWRVVLRAIRGGLASPSGRATGPSRWPVGRPSCAGAGNIPRPSRPRKAATVSPDGYKVPGASAT
jgi:hypothetical protein